MRDVSTPHEVLLARGSMQNWSDLKQGTGADAPLVRAIVERTLAGARSCLIAGSHSVDLVVAVAQLVPHLTVVTRSIPDAAALAQALAEVDEASVICGGLDAVAEGGRTFEAVICVDDLSRLQSLEGPQFTWVQLLGQIGSLVAPGGRALLGIINELGLDQVAAPRPRRARNEDADWAVLAAYDPSRPRSRAQVVAAVHDQGLPVGPVWDSFPAWNTPTVLATDPAQLTPEMSVLLGLLVTRSPALRRDLVDPSRVVRVAADVARLGDFPSGWLVEVVDEPHDATDPRIVEETDHGIVTYTSTPPDRILSRVGSSSRLLSLGPACELASEALVDASARHDLPRIRQLLQDYVHWIGDPGADGELDPERSDAALDNVCTVQGQWVVLTAGDRRLPAQERLGLSLAGLAVILRERGVRHPWPAYTGERGLVTILAAMAGVRVPDDIDGLLARARVQHAEASHVSAAGLLAQVDRLAEENAALRGRMEWFERRLDERERELRTISSVNARDVLAEQATQEELRRELEILRGSRPYRLGRFLLAPARGAKRAGRQFLDDA